MYTRRIDYLRTLRHLLPHYRAENILYFDESGFEETAFNPYARAPRDQKIYANKVGNHKKNRVNLIMAHRRKQWLAPVLFTGSCDHKMVEYWLENHLFKELQQPSLIIADNAPFHRKSKLIELCQKYGHRMLFLPPYSPDLNPIEHDFGTIKRKRYHQTLDLILGNSYFE